MTRVRSWMSGHVEDEGQKLPVAPGGTCLICVTLQSFFVGETSATRALYITIYTR